MAEPGKKPVLSSKVMQLKFMQRAQEKQKRVDESVVTEKQEAEPLTLARALPLARRALNKWQALPFVPTPKPPRHTRWASPALAMPALSAQAHWAVESARSRCVVVAEGDPVGGSLGRLSFKGFNPDTEKLQQEVEAREARRAAVAAGEDPEEGKTISDEALAAELAKRQQKQQQQERRHSLGSQGKKPQKSEPEVLLPLRMPKRQKR